MNMWTLIPVLIIVSIFVVLTLWQRRPQGSRVIDAERKQPFVKESAVAYSMNETDALPDVMVEEVWWKNVSSLHQLQLALHLAEMALPVWEKFTALQVVSYRAASAGSLTIIESNLLQKTVEEIILHAQLHFPDSDTMKINQYYKRFIGPVLALKDGIWVCAYPAKKIFLSVYFILMSIVEQHGLTANENFLSEAIKAALECMELSKLYTREEIASFLEAYRYSL